MVDDLYDGALEPIWFGDRKVYSVTGFSLGVRSRIVDLPSLWIQGEVSELRRQQRHSLVYFTLKDPHNGYVLNCTIGRTRFDSLGLDVRDGDLVQAFGRADIYARRGTFQLRVQSLEHAGRGLLMQQLEALKARLAEEGLFDEARKRALPVLPRRIGVVTGSQAAAQGDFLRNVYERFPPAKLVVVETLVQGERAAPQVVAAIRRLELLEDVDVIVVTRGGGAFEDFLPFSDERVCRAIAACRVPVVSAIGHEKDTPLSDFVADLRVSTPTAAARTVVPDHALLLQRLERQRQSIERRARDRMVRRTGELAALRARLANRSPARVLDDRRRFLSQLHGRSRMRVEGMVTQRRQVLMASRRGLATIGPRVERAREGLVRDRRDMTRCLESRVGEAASRHRLAVEKLRALSPASALARGYAIVRAGHGGRGPLVRRAGDVAAGDDLSITLGEGVVQARVEQARV